MQTKYYSAKALALISEFALLLYRYNGTIINVDSDDVLIRVAKNARYCSDDRLKRVYLRLRDELRQNLVTSLPQARLDSIQQLLADHGETRLQH